jgi:hypothetical protein
MLNMVVYSTMTKRGETPGASVSTHDALQAYANDTMGDRIQPETYRKSRRNIALGLAAATLAVLAAVYPNLKGGDSVDAASPAVPTAGASASSNTAKENGISFDCEVKSVNANAGDVTADGAKVKLTVTSSGRDHVTYRAPAFIEGAIDDMEVPMLGDGGAGDNDLAAQIPSGLFKKTIAVYAISGEDQSRLCGAFSYDPDQNPPARFESESDLPEAFPQ